MKKTLLASVLISILINGNIYAQQTDESGKSDANDERNVMLNASDANKPRDIPIGLPSTNSGTDVFEDGLPEAFTGWPLVHAKHWRSDIYQMGLVDMNETVIKNGNVGYAVNSKTSLNTMPFKGNVSYQANHFGLQKFNTGLSAYHKGWGINVNIYQNFDPGSTDLPYSDLQDRTEIYKVGLTRYLNNNRGHISVFYKYARNKAINDEYAPFIYVGDGSIRELDGFKLGTTNYMPADGNITYMDVETGEIINSSYNRTSTTHTNEIFLLSDFQLNNGWNLSANFKYVDGRANFSKNNGTSIIDSNGKFFYEDGSKYEGQVQNRIMLLYDADIQDFLATIELKKQINNHGLQIGFNEWYSNTKGLAMSSKFAHEVKSNPKRLLNENKETAWGFNDAAEYYDGIANKLAIYAFDNWEITPSFTLDYGLRMEYYTTKGDAANNEEGKTNDNRVAGFNLNKAGVTKNHFNDTWITPCATIKATYNVLHGFGFTGNYLFRRTGSSLDNYSGDRYPSDDPVDCHYGAFGVYYNNKWLQLVSNVSYISKNNFKPRAQYTKVINGVDETQTKTVYHDVVTWGWTTDMLIKPFKGFNLHFLMTLQSPKYKKFNTTLFFSDGSEVNVNYNDKTVTGISKVYLEIDPSYSIDRWKIGLNFRYFGKQYANKPNTIYFNGHWETFGSVEFKYNKHITLGVNVVNILNQTGATGSMPSGDLIEDASEYQNYIMSGNYIRPFTLEAKAKITF